MKQDESEEGYNEKRRIRLGIQGNRTDRTRI